MYDSDKRKLFAGLCHGSIFLSSLVVSVGIPIAILLVSDDPVVKENAKESLNFHFNVWLYGVILGALWFSVLGIPLFFLLIIPFFLFQSVPPILALIQVLGNPEQPYRYPFIFRIL